MWKQRYKISHRMHQWLAHEKLSDIWIFERLMNNQDIWMCVLMSHGLFAYFFDNSSSNICSEDVNLLSHILLLCFIIYHLYRLDNEIHFKQAVNNFHTKFEKKRYGSKLQNNLLHFPDFFIQNKVIEIGILV